MEPESSKHKQSEISSNSFLNLSYILTFLAGTRNNLDISMTHTGHRYEA